jgi:MHS family proline/betaine transporter-like MFS transporter
VSLFSLRNIKSILSSSVSNIIAWYEYTLYAYFATVISDLFFPDVNRYIATVLTFATFAVGLIARPIGGIVFGYLSDRYSRKNILTLTTILMSAATLGIGILPTYKQIGVLAPICLVGLRILQEFALGGCFGLSCVYLYESVATDRRGLLGCMAVTGVGLGLILSGCTSLALEVFVSPKNIYAFAWRIPFLIGIVGALVGLYMHKSLVETVDFVAAGGKRVAPKTHPFIEMIKNYKMTLFRLFSIYITTQTSFFVVFIFGKTMMIRFLGYDNSTASKFNLLAVLSYTVATVFFGYLSDRINKRYMIIFGSLGILLSAYPFIAALKAGTTALILLFSILMGTLMGMTVVLSPLTSEAFPTHIRTTGVAFSCNFTAVVFGGVSPVIAMHIIDYWGDVSAVAYYLITVCLITVVVTASYFFKLGDNRRCDC